jgi:hypothetical protein
MLTKSFSVQEEERFKILEKTINFDLRIQFVVALMEECSKDKIGPCNASQSGDLIQKARIRI